MTSMGCSAFGVLVDEEGGCRFPFQLCFMRGYLYNKRPSNLHSALTGMGPVVVVS